MTEPLRNKTSSWKITKLAFRETVGLYPRVLAKIWGWLLFLHLLQVVASEISNYAAEALRASGREDLGIIAAIAGIDMIFNLVWSAFWVLVLSLAAASFVPEIARRVRALPSEINQILIEQTRVLAAILWRAPLIIPAGIAWVRYTLVPFVVIFEPNYERGQVDALKRSRDLSVHHFWLINIYLLITALLPWLSESLTQDEKLYIWQNPIQVLLGSIPTFFINLASGIFLFSLYRHLARGAQSSGEVHAHLQLDGN